MPNLNKAMIMGRLGKDPEINFTKSGIQVANIDMATTKKSKGEEKTTWHHIVLWDKLAGICEKYLRKGDCIYVEGELEERTWTGQDGSTRYKTEIIAYKLEFIQVQGGDQPQGSGTPENDDVPF